MGKTTKEQLHETLETLHAQLDEIELDPQEEEELLEIVRDISEALQRGDTPATFKDRVLAFETKHPLLSDLLSKLAQTLSEMGI